MFIPIKQIAKENNLDLFSVSQAASKLLKRKQGEVNGKLAILEEAIPELFEILKGNPPFETEFEFGQATPENIAFLRATVTLTTTPTLTTHRIVEYKGVVAAEIGIGTGVFATLSIAVSDLGGAESDSLAKKFEIAKEQAFDKIRYDAHQMGCNAIISVSTNIMVTSREMVVYSVIGTAVRIEPLNT